jgi:hypothetical protein
VTGYSTVTHNQSAAPTCAPCESASARCLGLAALGVGAGELIATVQVAMQAGLPYTALRDTLFTYPTIAEGEGPRLLANLAAGQALIAARCRHPSSASPSS